MTHTITARNVNHALADAVYLLRSVGVQETSRNGTVLVAPGPVITEYQCPTERVLFEPRRDANPVFHLMEAIWMLAGKDDVRWLLDFNSKFGQYAEDDHRMHGAYGHRWRRHFGIDQVTGVVDQLRKKPDTRQAVVAMWSPRDDLFGSWRDRPCNTHIYFDRRGGKLNMMVNCRSNDMLWGAYGSNVVHFSILQELIAHELGVPVGTYWQNSFNFHVYMDLPLTRELLRTPPDAESYDYYSIVTPEVDDFRSDIIDLLQPGENLHEFLQDCLTMVSNLQNYKTLFMRTVANPLRVAYLARKAGNAYDLAGVPDCDWKLAFQQWCERRKV